jgi:tetratricopeptide (TPR) repeat protein
LNFNYSNYDIKIKRKKRKLVTFILLILFAIIIISTLSFFLVRNFIAFTYKNNEIKNISKKLYDQKNYTELIERMDKELKTDPFFSEYLVYRGFSYFLLGEEEKNIENRKTYFSSSIIDLRKSVAVGVPEVYKPNIFFCIGKIYYYFGEPYYNLSIRYLLKSLDMGNKRKDLYYILGLVYSNTGKYKESIENYIESLKIEENDLVLYAISVSYYKNNDLENSKVYLQRVMNISKDPKIRESSFLLMGEILFDQSNFSESLNYFDKVIEINENNSNAYFYRGEIFLKENDKIKARSEWRKALEIDPSHIRARSRYYSRIY